MNHQRGFSLVAAIFILVVLGLLGGYMLKLSAVQHRTFDDALQGAKAYQGARAGIEWAIARISNGGSCADIGAQTAMTFNGLEGFSVGLSCSSTSYSEANSNMVVYRINALAQFGNYTDSDYVAREIEVSIVN